MSTSAALKVKPFVFVMYGWRESTNCLAVPPNCVIYTRPALENEFGPTLAHFISTFELSPIRFKSISNVDVEEEDEEEEVADY